jgi:hypothetical protein
MFFLLIFGVPLLVAVGLFGRLIVNHSISETAWHIKLMHWVWGVTHESFGWMCTYAWSVFFTIFLIVPITFFKLLFKAFEAGAPTINEWKDQREHKCAAKKRDYIQTVQSIFMTEFELFKAGDLPYGTGVVFWDYMEIDGDKSYSKLSKRHKIMHDFVNTQIWAHNAAGNNAGGDITTFGQYISKAYHAMREGQTAKEVAKKAKKRERAEALKPVTHVISIWGKRLAKVLVFCLMAVVTYFLVQLVWWLIWLPWLSYLHGFMEVMAWLVVFGTGGLFVITFGPELHNIGCWFERYCIPCEDRRTRIANVLLSGLKYCLLPFIGIWWVLTKFWIFLVAIWNGFILFKEDNCPAIQWKE